MTIFSSCDHIDIVIDSTDSIGKNKTVELGKGAQLQEEGNSKRNLIIFISSGGVGFLLLILVVNGVVRKTKKKITIVDENAIYGRNEPNVYYEDGKNTQIEDKNEYYDWNKIIDLLNFFVSIHPWFYVIEKISHLPSFEKYTRVILYFPALFLI